MEFRNLQKTGGQSLTVTLPKQWIHAQNLKDKDKVKIFEDKRGRLIIDRLSDYKLKSVRLSSSESEAKENVFREIMGYYIAGVDEILVKTPQMSYEHRAKLREITYHLIGFDCVESSADVIVLRNIANLIFNQMPEFVERMLSTIYAMFSDTVIYLTENNAALAKDIIDRDDEVDRLHMVILRSFNIFLNQSEIESKSNLSVGDAYFFQLVGIRLERIGDHIVNIAENFLQHGWAKPNKPMLLHLKSTQRNISLCRQIVLQTDKVKSHEFLNQFIIQEKVRKSKPINHKDIFVLREKESLNRINAYIANIAEAVINYSNVRSLAA